MNQPSSRPRKRSRVVVLTTLTALGAAATLSACGSSPDEAQLSQQQYGEGVDAFPYQSVAECTADGKVPAAECERAQATALSENEKAAPRFEAQDQCEEQFGAGQCRQQTDGYNSYFSPLLTGFVIGRLLDGGSRYRHSGLYRDRRDSVYYTGGGGWIYRDPRTGVSKVGSRALEPVAAPQRVQTRSSVVSRGGFGGRASMSASASRGGWGSGGRGG